MLVQRLGFPVLLLFLLLVPTVQAERKQGGRRFDYFLRKHPQSGLRWAD